MYITPGSPWENGFVESLIGTMANELLNREIFDTLYEAKVLLARWVGLKIRFGLTVLWDIDRRHLQLFFWLVNYLNQWFLYNNVAQQ